MHICKKTICIQFYYRFTSNYFEAGKGFQLRYESTDVSHWSFNSGSCDASFTTPNGIITSPSYPDKYPNRANCVYTISQPTGTVILLNFHIMNTEEKSYGRCYDKLEIRDGISEASPILRTLCGSDIPAPLYSSQNYLWIK